MKIAINSAVISHPLTGVARYAFELGRSLSDLGVDVEYWTWDRFRAPLRERIGKGPVIRSFPHLKGIGTALVPGMKSFATHLDIYHFPNGDLLKCPVPKTAMIHDLAPFLYDDLLPAETREFYRERTRRLVSKCAAVMVNSRTTLDDLRHFFPERSDRYHLTPLGCDHELPSPGGASNLPPGVSPGYMLSVGTIEPRKNYGTLIKAYGLLARSTAGHDLPRLVIAGGDGFRSDEIRRLAADHGISGRIFFTGYVDDRTLSSLYSGASAYIHASVYEGFGLPVAEAMRHDLPVAAADNSSIRELFHGLYLPFDAGSPESAASAMAEALSGPVDEATRAGRRRVLESMTWERCARETLTAFRSVTGT